MPRFSRAGSDDRDRRRDGGFALPELLVSMAIFSIIMALVTGIVIRISQQAADNMTRARQVEEVRLGIMQIDRQVRSGNVISDPAFENPVDSGVPAGYSLRVYTQTNGVRKCVQWRMVFPDVTKPQGQLEYRSWDTNWQTGGRVETWSVVARDVVAPDTGAPFAKVDPLSGTTAQSVRVTIRVQGERTSSAPSTVSTVLTGRNTVYGYPSDMCSPVPAP